MKANELRIGNYIKRYNKVTGVKDVVQVDGVTPLLAFEGMTTLKFNPIPLTEQHLIDYGFTLKANIDGYYYEKNGCIIGVLKNLRETYFFFGPNRNDTYLHKLQNYYYALTNEELVK